MLNFRQLVGVVAVLLFLLVDEVSSFLRVARDGFVKRSSPFLSLRKPTATEHAVQRSRMTGLSGELPSLGRLTFNPPSSYTLPIASERH